MPKPKTQNLTVRFPVDLLRWLTKEAQDNRRSRSEHLIWIIEQTKKRKEGQNT